MLEENKIGEKFSSARPRAWLSFWLGSEEVLGKLIVMTLGDVMGVPLDTVIAVRGDGS